MDCTAIYKSPLGPLTLRSDGTHITGLWLSGQAHFPSDLPLPADSQLFQDAFRWLDRYFSGQIPSSAELPLAPNGSRFRRRIWDILLTIPYGKTMTYGEIAKRIATEDGVARMSAQAVGGAVGHNPISIIIPCHRVLGADGALTGYAGGIEAKRFLLKLEGIL